MRMPTVRRSSWLVAALLAIAVSSTAYSDTEAVFVVSGAGEAVACADAAAAALQQAQTRAEEKCLNYNLISTRYNPNLPDDSCAVAESGKQSRTVTLSVKCPAVAAN